MFSDSEYLSMLIIIGLITYVTRLTFVLYTPKLLNKESVKNGLDGISPSMLVGFVIPFTLFVDKRFELFRIEVFAISLAFIIVILTKKPSLGIVTALGTHVILSFFNK
ncbi:MAG: AzlD domain-containing protein [Candidatus Kariarchaeaceae archaeon]